MDIRRKLGFSLVALLVAVGLLEGLCRVLAPSGGLMQGALEPTEGDAQAIYMRGSPFLLWELAYAEMFFTDTLWPDFTRQHMAEAVAEFQNRTRRYGGVTA